MTGQACAEVLWAEASLLRSAQNAAFNNRTKEELEMHMFSKCGFSPLKLSSVCGFGNFILTVALAKDKKRERESRRKKGWLWGGGVDGAVRRLNRRKVGLTQDLIKKKKKKGFPTEIANTLGGLRPGIFDLRVYSISTQPVCTRLGSDLHFLNLI